MTLTVQNLANPYEYVEVRGRVAERTDEGADADIDALAKKYMGVDEYPLRQPGEQRVIVTRRARAPVRAGLSPAAQPRPSSRRHSDGGRGCARCHSSRSTS